jgi:hypothetical protein
VSTELRQGTYVDRRPIPSKHYFLDWLGRTKPTVSANTHALHEWAVKYLIAAFNLIAIQALNADQIERWQAELLSNGKPGPRSVAIIRGVLRMILEDAKAKGIIFLNPMDRVRRFAAPNGSCTTSVSIR